MSRAFTKEDDAGESLPERPIPAGPNYVTPRGLELLKETGRQLVARRNKLPVEGGERLPLDRDLRYIEARINSAIIVPVGAGPEARFGARVTIENPVGKREIYQIVGEDEARTDSKFIPWTSPLAQALFGSKEGDSVTWEGADSKYKVVSIEWPD